MSRITNEQFVDVTVRPTTDAGNPAHIDGDVNFTADSDAVVIERVDGHTARIFANDVTEATAVLITAEFDADLGEEVAHVSLTGVLEVVPAQATGGVIEFGEPQLGEPEPGPVS